MIIARPQTNDQQASSTLVVIYPSYSYLVVIPPRGWLLHRHHNHIIIISTGKLRAPATLSSTFNVKPASSRSAHSTLRPELLQFCDMSDTVTRYSCSATLGDGTLGSIKADVLGRAFQARCSVLPSLNKSKHIMLNRFDHTKSDDSSITGSN